MRAEHTAGLAFNLVWACGAYLGAVIVGTMVCVSLIALLDTPAEIAFSFDQLGVMALLIGLCGGVVVAPIAAIGVWAIKLMGAPRPWAEVALGAVAAFAGSSFLLFGMMGPGNLEMLQFVLPTAPAGAAAGGAYWLLAGRPRPKA